MEKNEKKFYAPPTMKVTQVVLERPIIVESLIRQVDLENWDKDEYPLNHESNNTGVWLDM